MVSIITCQKVLVYGQLTPQDNNDENRQTQSPCPSNWSDDLYVVDDNNDENMEQTDQPTDQSTTLTGTRVSQDVLADTSTTLRLPQTISQVLKIQKQNGKTKQKTRPPYMTWTWKKSQKQDGQNRNKKKGRKENGTRSYLYRWVKLD